MCNDSGPAFYFQSSNFLTCSSGCMKCNSGFECVQCMDKYFLHYDDVSKFSCLPCSGFYNCSSCMYGNTTKEINYSDFKNINSITEFNTRSMLYKWDISCLTCINYTYTRKTDAKCYLCTDLINHCNNCSYGNDMTPDISAKYQKNLIFMDFTNVIQNFFVHCFACDSFRFPLFTGNIVTCEFCNISISNCKTCDYGYLNSSGSLIFTKDYYNTTILSYADYRIRCLDCIDTYGLLDYYQISCSPCPTNCEYCYLNYTNSSMFCGRCLDSYILLINYGICDSINNSNYAAIMTFYGTSCLKTVSNNPWYANLSGTASKYLCQKCSNSLYYPSINGQCVTCANSTCSSCIEASTYITYSSYINYTNLLIISPLNLTNYISSSTDYKGYQRCLKCSNSIYGYSTDFQACCNTQTSVAIQPMNPPAKIIDGCSSCSSCSCILTSVVCQTCSSCSNIDPGILSNLGAIQSLTDDTGFNNFLFGKKIYYLLMEEASTYNITPVLNDTQTYTYIFNNLTTQTRYDLAGSSIYQCSACPISSKTCYIPDSFDFNQISSDFIVKNNDLTQQLSYQLNSLECKSGFIYDFEINRCKFCPLNWTSCKAYKRFDITFSLTEKSGDPFTITTLTEFLVLLQELEFGTLNFIMNEFGVKNLEIFILFPSSFEFIYTSTTFNMISTLKSRIPSLANFSVIFQPINYEQDQTEISYLYFGTQLILNGFDNIYFKNIVFYVYSSYIVDSSTLTIPGIISNISNNVFSMINCQILPSDDDSVFLIDGILYNVLPTSETYLGPFDFFSLILDVSFIYINQLIFDCSINLSADLLKTLNGLQIQMYFFQLSGEQIYINDLNIQQLKLNYGAFMLLNYFQNCNLSNFSLKNLEISHCDFILTAQLSVASFQLDGLSLKDSSFHSGYFFFGSLQQINILNSQIYNSSFYGFIDFNTNTFQFYFLFMLNVFNFNNISIIQSDFYHYNLFSFQNTAENSEIYNILYENNIYYYFDINSFALIFSSTSYGINLNFKNFTFLSNKITLKSDIAQSNFFIFTYIVNISLVNISMLNNENISGFSIQESQYITVINMNFSNKNFERTNIQTVFLFNYIHFQLNFSNCFFENILTNNGLINIQNWMSDSINGSIYIEKIIANFIYYNEVNSNTGSAFIIFSKKLWQIQMVECIFLNSFLMDQSDYDGSTLAISIDSIDSSF